MPSNVVTQESQPFNNESKDSNTDIEMVKMKSLSQYNSAGLKKKKSSFTKTDRQVKADVIRCLITNPSLNLLSPEEVDQNEIKQGSVSKKLVTYSRSVS